VRARSSIVPFLITELLLLLAVVVPVIHARSFIERLWRQGQTSLLPSFAPDEGRYILIRALVMVLVLQVSFAFRDLYRWTVITRPQLVVMRLIEGVATALVLLPLLHYVFGALDGTLELHGALRRLQIHPMLVLAGCGAAFLVAYGLRVRWPRWMRQARLGERVLMVGDGPGADVIVEEIRRRKDPGVELVGRVPELPDLRDAVGRLDVQRVVVDPAGPGAGESLTALRLSGVRVSDLGAFYEQLTGRLAVESLLDPRAFLGTSGAAVGYSAASRVLDLVASSLGLALSVPLCALVALAIRLESRGPALYRQERVGLNGRVFTLIKFRSMRSDAEASSGPVWAQEDDPRITRVGRWIRRLRIDEIPQLWNVIRDDMSLVGPRPERPVFVAELGRQLPHYADRHTIKPGVTGWAQINHSYGNSLDDAFIKLQYDLYYLKHRSLALDIAILLRTVKVVALQEGAV
jgi:exopolysaccharide biosynthesis polyprenyl glycosylphosphotransferase